MKGQDGNITHLKSFLTSSPQQQRNVGALPLGPPAEVVGMKVLKMGLMMGTVML